MIVRCIKIMNYRNKTIERCMLVTNICNWIKVALLSIGFCALICFIFGLFGIQSTLTGTLRDLADSPSIVSGYGMVFGGGMTAMNTFFCIVAVILAIMVIGPLVCNIVLAVTGHHAIAYYQMSGLLSKCKTNFVTKLVLETLTFLCIIRVLLSDKSIDFVSIALCVIQLVSIICSIIGLCKIQKEN